MVAKKSYQRMTPEEHARQEANQERLKPRARAAARAGRHDARGDPSPARPARAAPALTHLPPRFG